MTLIKQTLGQQVEQILRKQIMLLELQEGEHLKETVLAKQFNLSRGPIRDAIKKLEAEGLVKTLPSGRTVVGKFDLTYVENLYKFRILLETYAVKQLQPEVIEAEAAYLQAALQQMKEATTAEAYEEADLAIHFKIVEMTNNLTLIQSWLALKDLFMTLVEVTTAASKERDTQIIAEHEAFIEAIIKQDLHSASEHLQHHLQGAASYYSEAVFTIQTKGD